MSFIDLAQRTRRWRTGLSIQARVIHALMIRDALSHHGHENLGFFWIIGEPLFLMIGIMVLWSLTHMGHGDVAVIPFALTGYSYLTLWRHISGRSVRILRRNRMIRFHRHVKLFDAILANAALETMALFATFLISYVPLFLFGVCPPIRDPLTLVGGFVMTGWFAFGFGMILAGLSELTDVLNNVLNAIMYITLPLTGAFTMQEWLPDRAQYFFSWSPLVNCVEMLRSGLFPESVATHYSVGYLIVSSSIATIIGFNLCIYAENHIQD